MAAEPSPEAMRAYILEDAHHEMQTAAGRLRLYALTLLDPISQDLCEIAESLARSCDRARDVAGGWVPDERRATARAERADEPR